MNKTELIAQILKKRSFLCVGLDTDLEKIPTHLQQLPDAVFQFNKSIIDATAAYTVAFKPNTAFYESEGTGGWESLEKTITYIKKHYPEIMVIADAKRGDIGNTSRRYAKAFLSSCRPMRSPSRLIWASTRCSLFLVLTINGWCCSDSLPTVVQLIFSS